MKDGGTEVLSLSVKKTTLVDVSNFHWIRVHQESFFLVFMKLDISKKE